MKFSGRKWNFTIGLIQFERVIEVENDGEEDGQCSLSGHLGGLMTLMLKALRVFVDRCTFKVSNDYGSYNHTSGLYSGAIGALQRNETQGMALPVYYPLHDMDQKYFEYTWPFKEDRMMIACAYNSSYHKMDADVTAMFTSVDYELWIAVLCSFAMFVVLLETSYRILGVSNKYKSPLWMVTSAFLFEDDFPDDTTFNKIVNACACVFLFFFGGYLMNCMSSDLVVYVNPPVITSYADALQRVENGHKLTIVFPPALPESEMFREADPASIEGRLFKLRSTLLDKGADGRNLPVAYFMSQLTQPVLRTEAIGIMREDALKAVTAWVLHVAGDLESFKSMNALLNIDPETLKFTNVVAFQKSIDLDAKKILHSSTLKLTEAGIPEKVSNDLPYLFSAGKSTVMLETRSSEKVMTPELELPYLQIGNTTNVWIIVVSMVGVSIMILLIEIFHVRKYPKEIRVVKVRKIYVPTLPTIIEECCKENEHDVCDINEYPTLC